MMNKKTNVEQRMMIEEKDERRTSNVEITYTGQEF